MTEDQNPTPRYVVVTAATLQHVIDAALRGEPIHESVPRRAAGPASPAPPRAAEAPPTDSNLPRGRTFRGNVLAHLTLIERSQGEGNEIVEGIAFGSDSTRLALTSGHEVQVAAWATAEEIHRRIAAVTPVEPIDVLCWVSFPAETTPWSTWLTLHYSLASLEKELEIILPGLHYRSIRRVGDIARIVTGLGDERFDHEVPLTEEPLAAAVDLAFEARSRHLGRS